MKIKGKIIGSILGLSIMLIAVVAFIVSPALVAKNSVGNLIVFGSWDGIKITNEPDSEFFAQYRSLTRLFEMFGGNIPDDPNQREYINLQMRQTAMSSALVNVAMESEAEKAGYKPSAKLVNMAIIQQFTDPATGLYSRDAFENTSEARKLQLRSDVIKNLKRDRYIKDVLGYGNDAYGIKVNENESKFVASLSKEKRRFDYIAFSSEDFPRSKKIEFAKESGDLFNKHDLTLISFKDEASAKSVANSILKGETTFEDAFENRDTSMSNTNVDSNGKLISPYRKDLNRLFPNAEDLDMVLNIKPSEVGSPVKLGSVYVIIKNNSEPQKPDFSDPNLLDTVFYYMRQYESGKIEDYLMEKAGQFSESANKNGFNTAVREFSADRFTSSAFSVNYGNSSFLDSMPYESDPILARAIKNEGFFKTTFDLKYGQTSKPILIDDKAVVLKLIESSPVDTELKGSSYNDQLRGWNQYYMLSLLTRQYPMKIAQSIVINFFVDNPKAVNDLNKYQN